MAHDAASAPPRRVGDLVRARAWWSLLAATIALAAVVAWAISPNPTPHDVRGARLGMTASQVRARFAVDAPATWRSDVAGPDTVLEREPSGPFDRPVRFEFHAGMLVAIRLDVPSDAPEALGPPRLVTTATLTARTPSEDGRVRVVVLARDCPTHADEVRRLLTTAP